MSSVKENATIKVRRDTAANFTSNDPTLGQGEWGYETDTGYLKIGDGSTAWTSLAYKFDGTSLTGSQDQLCKAWVNFDGTTNVGGFCTIRDNYNVTSVTDNGVGDYTITFTTAMSDTNYTISCSSGGTSAVNICNANEAGGARSTTSVDVAVLVSSSGAAVDDAIVNVQIFGS